MFRDGMECHAQNVRIFQRDAPQAQRQEVVSLINSSLSIKEFFLIQLQSHKHRVSQSLWFSRGMANPYISCVTRILQHRGWEFFQSEFRNLPANQASCLCLYPSRARQSSELGMLKEVEINLGNHQDIQQQSEKIRVGFSDTNPAFAATCTVNCAASPHSLLTNPNSFQLPKRGGEKKYVYNVALQLHGYDGCCSSFSLDFFHEFLLP